MIGPTLQQAQAAHQAGNFAEAERLYETVLRQVPPHPALLSLLGQTQLLQQKWTAALFTYDRLVALKPDLLEAAANRGILLQQMGRHAEALEAFQHVVALNPGLAESHNQIGTALSDLGRLSDAIVAYRTAITLNPKFARAYFNLGNALGRSGAAADAVAAYDAAFALEPDMPDLRAARFFIGFYIFQWQDYETDCRKLLDEIDAGHTMEPFRVLFLPSSAAQLRANAERYAALKYPPLPPLPRKRERKPGRLRVAYVSKDFNEHPVTYLITETLERHDRSQFEFFAISHGIDDKSPARTRVTKALEHFVGVQEASDAQIAQRMRDLDIDIAIDLDGYTMDCRPAILSTRPARVQVNYLGYAGTMGAPHIDYLIADDIIIPPEHAAFYSEKLVWLPGNYLPGCSRPEGKTPSRAEAGLPEYGFIFCGFTASYKITPDVFSCWMRILARVPGSVLWLRSDIAIAQDNMRQAARIAGIDPSRLIFAAKADAKTHFGRLALADLYLDTFIYGAHTTASDALSVGVPVVTLLGGTFARRVAASLLTRTGLTELITQSPEQYEDLAVALAEDPVRLEALKKKVRLNSPPLFDAARFARYLEAAYLRMWERHEAGEKPESFAVEA